PGRDPAGAEQRDRRRRRAAPRPRSADAPRGVPPLRWRVLAPARARVLEGTQVPAREKVLSLFESHTRVVTRAKAGAPVEFGRQVVCDEVEGGLVTRFHVLTDDESECHQALPAVRHHVAAFGHPSWLVAGDRRLYSKGVEQTAQGLGVTCVVILR